MSYFGPYTPSNPSYSNPWLTPYGPGNGTLNPYNPWVAPNPAGPNTPTTGGPLYPPNTGGPLQPPVTANPTLTPLQANDPFTVGGQYPNGAVVVAIYNIAQGKQLAELVTADNKKVWVDMQHFGSWGQIPDQISTNLAVNPVLISAYDNPNNSGVIQSPAFDIMDLPLPGPPYPHIIMNEYNGGGPQSTTWYGYMPDSNTSPNSSYVGYVHYDPVVTSAGMAQVNGISIPPKGRNIVNFSGWMGSTPFAVPGAPFHYSFTNQGQAAIFAALYGGSVTAVPTYYPNNPVSQADLQGLLNQGWMIANVISKYEDVPGLVNILQGTPEYDNAVAQGYIWMQTGTQKVLVNNGTAQQKFDDITKDKLAQLQAQYPNLTFNQDGFFPGSKEIYNNGQKIVVDSDLYKKLKAEGWQFTPADPLVTNMPMVVATKTGVSEAEKNALLALNNGWKVTNSYVVNNMTSKTVSVTGLTQSQLAQYSNKTGYKIVKEYDVQHPTDPVVEQWKVDNKTGGLWGAEGIDVGDGSGTLTAAGLKASYDKSTYKVTSPFAKPSSLNPSDMFVDKNAAVDKVDSFAFYGDPGAHDYGDFWNGGGMDDAAEVGIHPDANIYNVVNGGNSKFCFSVNQIIEPINDQGNVAARAYGYVFDFEGQEYKLLVKDGQATLTKPDGTTQVIDPKVGLKLPAGANPALVDISEQTIPGAGYNGADEKRLNIRFAELASDSVVADLKAKGFSDAEIFEKTTNWNTIHHGFRIPEDDADGAYTPYSSGTSAATPEASNGVKTYYDSHWILEKPDKVFTKTTTGSSCEKKFDIEYTQEEGCNETRYDLEQVKDCPKETPQVTAYKDVPGEPKYDACVPGSDPQYKDVPVGKFQQKTDCYELKKEVYNVDGTTPGLSGKCVNGSAASPLALDLNGDGVKTTANPWQFNLDGTGVKTWNASLDKNDAWMVFDKDGDNTLDDGTELFGNHTAVGDGQHDDGLQALRAYADQYLPGASADGVLSAAEIAQLENQFNFRIQIMDSQGNPQLVKPSTLGITQFSLNPDPNRLPFTDANGVYHNPRTFFNQNGVAKDLDDLWFKEVTPTIADDSGFGPEEETDWAEPTDASDDATTTATGSGSSSSGNTSNTAYNQPYAPWTYGYYGYGQPYAGYNYPPAYSPYAPDAGFNAANPYGSFGAYPSYPMNPSMYGGYSDPSTMMMSLMSLFAMMMFPYMGGAGYGGGAGYVPSRKENYPVNW
ncbi:MAG: hypothetical protein U0003_02150 [Vampirovibrionales bacterium]